MLVGGDHRGGIRPTTTINGHSYVQIHSGFKQCGCTDSMERLILFLKNESNPEIKRFIAKIPHWVTDTCFTHACTRTTIRDAMEYSRRFLRLRMCLESASFPTDTVVSSFNVSRIERAVAIARMSFGAALEAAAALAATRICDVCQLPAEAPHTINLAWLCHDAYMAALWTDAHAKYVMNVLVESSPLHDVTGPHIDVGRPCIENTISVSSLPNLGSKFERFCSNASNIDDHSKHLVSVIFRCGQSGSRGWDSALKTSLDSDGSQAILQRAFKMALVGMHPQIHPAARPDWSERALIVRILDENLTRNCINKVMISCATATKESIRLYMCSVLNEIPATRLALSKVHNSIGLLRSAPSELVHASLAAAAQNIVAAGIATAAALSKTQPSGLTSQQAIAITQETISAHIGNEPRVRSRSNANSRPIQIDHNTSSLVLSNKNTMRTFYSVSYSPSWFGRMITDGQDDISDPNGTSHTQASNSMNITTVVYEFVSRAFRSYFVPFWLHGHGNDIRTSRMDASQHAHMLDTSSVHAVVKNIDENEALRVQRIALRKPTSATSTVSQSGELLGLSEDDQNKLDDAKTFEEAINAICSLSPQAGASLLLFGKITYMKNQFLSFYLGPETSKRQLDALIRRFEIDPNCENPVDILPDHAFHLYMCLECKRIPNACVDDKSKMVSHNEVGLAQTMLRVGGVGDEPEVRCARRSSAALRTAVMKEGEAVKNRIELIKVNDESIEAAMASNGDVAHAARLRRDIRTCSEQHQCALGCGDRPLIKISLIGRVVRVNGRFYSLCSLCGSILQVSQMKRFAGDLCCCRCDTAMVGIDKPAASQATRVAVEVDNTTTRPPPYVFDQIVTNEKLRCRFCNRSPPTSATASKFKIFRTPRDGGGRNAVIPPPLRTIALCSSHYRPWIQNALNTMSMQCIFAHISAKAVPVFGADVGRRQLALTIRRPTAQQGNVKKRILKRALNRKASSSSSKR